MFSRGFLLATGRDAPRETAWGRRMGAQRMVAAVRQAAKGWQSDVVSLGYLGRVHKGRPVDIPRVARGGGNDNAFVGDQRMWEPRWEFE